MRPIKGRANTWELRIYLGRDPEGRVRHRHATCKQSERELARLITEQDSKPAPMPTEARRWTAATINQ
jgi:hypothetical protein